MFFCMPSNNCNKLYDQNDFCKLYKTLEEALNIIKVNILHEKKSEQLYSHIISAAPTQEEKDIITKIQDQEKKHSQFFRQIYEFYTGQTICSSSSKNIEKPNSYIDGIKKAKLNELASIEEYRHIRAGIPHEYYRDMVFEILTDKLINAQKYDYILYLTLENNMSTSIGNNKTPTPSKSGFTLKEADQIAKTLGIDFSKEKFDLNQFLIGLNIELEHGKKYNPTNVTEDHPLLTGKIALAHLHEFPDYYTRLAKLEKEAKAYWSVPKDYLRRAKEFTPDELAYFDGTMGKPAYVAVDGIIYDVSRNPQWNGGVHLGLTAGKDLTSQFESCHGVASILQNLSKVGVLKS